MANTKSVIIKIKRQDSPEAKSYWEEFELPPQPGRNVISALMEIAANPVTREGKPTTPIVYDSNCLEEVCGSCAMVQGGDPKGDGTGSPGYEFKNEVSPDLTFDRAGRLAYANSGPDTNGSQFFITEQAFTGQQGQILNGHYTIFGQCDDATVALVKQIARMDRDPSDDRPFRPVKIVHINIVKAGAATPARRPSTPTPAAKKPTGATPKSSTPQ